MEENYKFYKQRHVKFFCRCLDVLPNAYQTLDTNRMTVLFFAIYGLDILGEIETAIDEKRRKDIISWVYSLQALSPSSARCTEERTEEQTLGRTEEQALGRTGGQTGEEPETIDGKNGKETEEKLGSHAPNGVKLIGSDVIGYAGNNNSGSQNGLDTNGDSGKNNGSIEIERISAMVGFRSSPGNGARLSSSAFPIINRNSSIVDAEKSTADAEKSTADAAIVPRREVIGSPVDNLFDSSHVTMTYNALATLLILKDDLSGVDRTAVLRGLKHLQQPDGSFSPMCDGGERDMRFVFCAAAICSILADDLGEGMDVQKAAEFVTASLTYEGGFGMCADAEAHGGSSFCALGSLVLMNNLHSCLSNKRIQELKRWLCFRQASGFQGRANKPVDCCYTFWVGASLKLLDAFSLAQIESNVHFTLSCQNPITGGFAKWPDCHPDALHACLGLAGLSLLENEISVEDTKEETKNSSPKLFLRPICPSLNITTEAFQHLLKLQQSWKTS